ncbi:hypothetical protein NA57DRAFT_74398 [Rhizodiscina lignyota]|uniref:Uncharacterized protein n=1 Tax=Rhizodiscina lignyota TaxID=1504668 RepID=A0A9P4ILU2_9PEZI|nr:hypothetical protein NA57DRAFT_74398 [Rhizodiscina lignyota]
MATTRGRKAFRYPNEDETEPADGIDEEEQEKVISSFRTQDAAQTEFYLKIFLALPISTVLLYLPSLLRPSSSQRFLTTFFCISSLLFTAFVLWFYPLGVDPTSPPRRQTFSRRSINDWLLNLPASQQWYIFILNAVLCAVLALQSILAGRGGRKQEEVWPPGWLPGCVFALVMVARVQLKPVDVEELEKLKYHYKGA